MKFNINIEVNPQPQVVINQDLDPDMIEANCLFM